MRRSQDFGCVVRSLTVAAASLLLLGYGVATTPVDAAPAEAGSPQASAARKPVVKEYAPGVPPVILSAAHAALCKVGVGEAFPSLELPTLDGAAANREALAGAKATVVLIWTTDRWMSETALRDLAAIQADGVAVVGIAAGMNADSAQKLAAAAGAKFPQLLDADASVLAQVGADSLPRIYVIDSQRRIAWFDIEYSEATRREVNQTLATLTAGEAR